MKEYNIVELSDGSKCIIIDALEYDNIKYFLLGEISDDEDYINNELEICLFNSDNRYFEEVLDGELYILLKAIFEERISNQVNIIELLESIDYNTELKVVNIDNYDYTLEKITGDKIIKNIEFIGGDIPLNSTLYINEKIIKHENIFTFGMLYDYNNINSDNIIKVLVEDNEYYLQRYYG